MHPSRRGPRPAPNGRRVAAALVVVAVGMGGLLPSAGAAPGDDKRAQAAQLQDEIEATDLQIGALGEQVHAAEARRDLAQQAISEAEVRIERAKVEVAAIRQMLREASASLYQGGRASDTGVDFGDAADLARRDRYAEAHAEREERLLEDLRVARADLKAQRSDATEARDAAAAEREKIAAAQAEFEAVRAQQQALLDQVTGELAAEVAAERARREEASRVKYSVPPGSFPDVGPPNGSASQAIAFARAVIGSGYSKNPRMGPTYDCSGLTFMAWKSAGVSIPTVSGPQYSALPHVPLNALQPGDLIFWGPGGSAHVALYIGGGQIIDASSSQGQVTLRGIWGDPIGAARVT